MTLSKRRRFRLFLLGLNLAVFAVVIAAFFWVTESHIAKNRPSTLVYAAHPFARQVLRPEQSYRRREVAFRIGPHGLRGEAPTRPKPEGVTRIFAVGGSAVFDHLTSESWPERLAAELGSRGLTNVESFNGGVPGYSSRDTLALYYDKISRYAPDVVILYQGWNDAKYMRLFLEEADVDRHYRYRGPFADQYRFLTEPRPWRNLHALSRMWDSFTGADGMQENRADDDDPAVPTPVSPGQWATSAGMRFYERNVRALVRQVGFDGGLCVLVAQASLAVPDLPAKLRSRIVYRFVDLDHDELVAVNDAMADSLARVAREEGVPFVDVRQSLNGRPEYFKDHVHLEPEGSRLLATLVAEALVGILSRGPEIARRQWTATP